MPNDVCAALDRFQRFIGSFPSDAMIDADSGFTAAAGILLAGEIEMAAHQPQADDQSRIV